MLFYASTEPIANKAWIGVQVVKMNDKRIRGDVLYADLSYRILQAAFEVHNQLGPGFLEEIYERAFVAELDSLGIPYERQKVIKVFYKGSEVGTFRLDLLVANSVILELKAVTHIQDVFKAQLISYLKAADMQLGLLINFANRCVEHQRFINSKGNPIRSAS